MDKKFINIPEDPVERKKFLTVFICSIAALILLAVLVGCILGLISNKIKNKKPSDADTPTTISQENTSAQPAQTTEPPAEYSSGYYIVQYPSRLRSDKIYDAANGNVITQIPADSTVYIDSVYKTEDAEHVWWGLIERYAPDESNPALYYTGYIWMEGLVAKPAEATEPAVTSATSGGIYSQAGDYTTKNELRLRTGAGTTFDTLTVVPAGTAITVTEVSDTGEQAAEAERYWGKTTYNGNTGYIAMFYVTKQYSSGVITPANEETTAEVTDTSLYAPGTYTTTAKIKVRTGTDASSDDNVLGTYEKDSKVEIIRIVQTSKTADALKYWGEISYQGQTAYISMYYLEA